MAIDVQAVREWPFPELRQTYTACDTILYALALGFGSDPDDEAELRFVYERDLLAMPTMAVTLCYPGFWISDPATGIDARKAVHGEQLCTFHRPLQPSGSVVGRVRVTGIIDKGRDRGALVVTERVITDAETGAPIATLEQRTLCRGDGGFEAATPALRNEDRQPQVRASTRSDAAGAPPDSVIDLPVSSRAALLYRLSADLNPLHADPAVARAAGFERPILHGLCTYGIAARALVRGCCGGDPHALERMEVRFSAPMYPGETLRTEMWRDGTGVRFRCLALGRDVVVMSNGTALVG
jgi:acyl dehydratase